MISAGRTSTYPVFVAGFGNRPTDTMAYHEAGIDLKSCFLINPESNLMTAADCTTTFASYSDPNALLWLLPKIKYKVPVEFVRKIDELTTHELERAEQVDLARLLKQPQQPTCQENEEEKQDGGTWL